MARIVIADRTNRYNGRDVATRPLGGTEMSVIYLAEALARRRHAVTCLTHGDEPVVHQGVTWSPLGAGRAGPTAARSGWYGLRMNCAGGNSSFECGSIVPFRRPARRGTAHG